MSRAQRRLQASRGRIDATARTDAVTGVAWLPRHAALLRAVDELHDTARLSQPTWDELRQHYDDAQLLEFLVLAGWYRTIAYVANGLLLDEEPWATPFPATAQGQHRDR